MPINKVKTHDGRFEYRVDTFYPKLCGGHLGVAIKYNHNRQHYFAEPKCEIRKFRSDGQFRTMEKCIVCTNEDYEAIKKDIEEAVKKLAKWEIKTKSTGQVVYDVNNYGIAENVLEELKKK